MDNISDDIKLAIMNASESQTDSDVKAKRDVLSALVAKNPDLNSHQLEKVVDVILEEMSMALSLGDRVEIRGFGSMSIRRRKSCSARNPRSGAQVNVEERAALYFRPSRDVVKQMNADNDN